MLSAVAEKVVYSSRDSVFGLNDVGALAGGDSSELLIIGLLELRINSG